MMKIYKNSEIIIKDFTEHLKHLFKIKKDY